MRPGRHSHGDCGRGELPGWLTQPDPLSRSGSVDAAAGTAPGHVRRQHGDMGSTVWPQTNPSIRSQATKCTISIALEKKRRTRRTPNRGERIGRILHSLYAAVRRAALNRRGRSAKRSGPLDACQTGEGRGRGFDEWQNPANLGEKLHLQPRPLAPVLLCRLGQLFHRLWREAESTQLPESRP